MKSLSKILLILFALPSGSVPAQNRSFVTGGIIQFEKTVNMFAILKKKVTKDHPENKAYYEQYLKNEPQFLKYASILAFNAKSSLFSPLRAGALMWEPIADQLNIVFSDFTSGMTTTQKEFYERTYLIKDTLRKIKWKITDETRPIAGYNCRRANGLVLDSVYVVAFYAEDIHVPAGPESFNGLPGMILQVVLPHEHVSWQAIKVTPEQVDEKMLAPPEKGTIINYKQFYQILWESQHRYGEIGRYFIKGFYL